jgi:hypothetical protein
LQDQPIDTIMHRLEPDLQRLVETVASAIFQAHQTNALEDALGIRDKIHQLPDYLVTEVINGVMLDLVQRDPEVCRWFIIDVFLRDADPSGKADVAERINLLMADLRSQ